MWYSSNRFGWKINFRNGFDFGFNWTYGGDSSSKTCACLAGYHNPRSITWRWALYWNKPLKGGVWRLPSIDWQRHCINREITSICLKLPFVGAFHLAIQENMFVGQVQPKVKR